MTALSGLSTGRIVDNDVPLDVIWLYSDSNPLEVCMTLSIQRGEDVKCCAMAPHPLHRHHPIRWVFARALLDEALQRPGRVIGHGDVNIMARPQGTLHLYLSAASGEKVEVVTEVGDACDFMLRSYMLVPANRESVDVDAAIALLLGSAS